MGKFIDKIKVWVIFVISAGVLITLDLWLKVWAENNLQNNPPRILINGFLGLRYTENTGAAFGFLSGQDWAIWILSIVKILLIIFILIYYYKLPLEKKYWLARIPAILVFAGGVGNFYDRVAMGAVRDMFEFLFMRFAIFNLADVFIVSGIISWAVFEIFVIKDFVGEKPDSAEHK